MQQKMGPLNFQRSRHLGLKADISKAMSNQLGRPGGAGGCSKSWALVGTFSKRVSTKTTILWYECNFQRVGGVFSISRSTPMLGSGIPYSP